VERGRVKNILAEFFPGLGFRENGMAKRTGAIAALLRVADLEDQHHPYRIREAEEKDVGMITCGETSPRMQS
jgi:hypothetical protein